MIFMVYTKLTCLLLCLLIFCSYDVDGRPVPKDGNAVVANDIDSRSLGYLLSKGYLTASSPWVGDITGPAKVKDAVTKFQKFMGIPETGIVDKETVEYMLKPRCGMRDIPNSNDRRKKRYLIQGSKWENGTNKRLTWALENQNNDGLSDFKVRQILKQSFSKWALVADLKFIELVNKPINSAIIRVRFAQLGHGDPYPFDGPGNTFAHGFFPQDNKGFSGDIHLDDAEVFTDDPHATKDKKKLMSILVHEIGHAIGLQHSDVKGSIMYPIYNHFEGSDIKLTHDDITAIQIIYGGNREIGPPPRPPRPSSAPRKLLTTVITTTKSPTSPPPPGCTDVMRAAYVGINGYIYVINNDTLYILFKYSDGVLRGPIPVSSVFREITKIDSVFRRNDGFLVFFHGDKFSVYNEQTIRVRHPRYINHGFQDVKMKLENIDAAFVWPENKKLYIFKGENYWRFSQLSNLDYHADYGYPQIIYYKWGGLPKTIDTAFEWTNGVMYFTKDQYYYRWDERRKKVARGYPIKLSRSFLKCEVDRTVFRR